MEKASRSTVSYTLLMLRLTRMLSLCHRARDKNSGRVLGNIYVLHDEPLPLLDVQVFDPGYLSLLLHCVNHAHQRLRAVAEKLITLIHHDESLSCLSSCLNGLQERMLAQQISGTRLQRKPPRRKQQNSSYPANAPGLENSAGRGIDLLLPESTAIAGSTNKTALPVVQGHSMHWPIALNLSENEQQIAQKLLQKLPQMLAQAVLNDVALRVARGGIQKPTAYLLSTIKKAQLGQFNALGREPVKALPPPISEKQAKEPVRCSEPQHVAILLKNLRKKYGLRKKES